MNITIENFDPSTDQVFMDKLKEARDKIIEESKKISLEDSLAAKSAIQEMFKRGELKEMTNNDELLNKYIELSNKASLAMLHEDVKRYEKTLTQELIKVPEGVKFIISNSTSSLWSPAGFHPSQRVFIKPESDTILGVDVLPKTLPNNQTYCAI